MIYNNEKKQDGMQYNLKKNIRVGCCFCDYKNFGDQLNRFIFKKEVGIDIYWVVYERAEIFGIGSIMAGVLRENEKQRCVDENIYCFTPGFACEQQVTSLLEKERKLSLIRPVNFLAVRGKLTLQLLMDNGLVSSENMPILGDGGGLACDLLESRYEKKYEVGIVAHAQEAKHPVFRQLLELIPNSVLIDIQQNPIHFLEKLDQCETVISTAMHPLIASDSLGIPNMWIRLPEKDTKTDRFKFDDYYSAYNLKKEPLNVFEIQSTVKQDVIENYDVPAEMVKEKQNELREQLKILKIELVKRSKEIKRQNIKNYIYMALVFYPRKYLVQYPIRIYRKIKRMIGINR